MKDLDEYEKDDLDEQEYPDMDPEAKKRADEAMNRRDQTKKFGTKIPAAILNEMEEDEDDLVRAMKRRRKMMGFQVSDEEEEKIDVEKILKRDEAKGKLSEWLQQAHVIRYIRNEFSHIIKDYKDAESDNLVYENRIIEMCKINKQSLEVNYEHIQNMSPKMAPWVLEYPQIVIPYLDDVAFELTCELFPNYSEISKQIFVRIKDIPGFKKLRDLRCNDIGHLVKISGVVTKRSSVYPKMKVAFFTCLKCGERNGPFNLTGVNEEIILGSCPVCQANGPYRKEPDLCIYRNYQRLVIQESPGTVPPGRVPRQKEIILTNDLVDNARPGDEVEITGIYKSMFDYSSNLKHSFPIFTTFIEANCIKRTNDIEVNELTNEDKETLGNWAKKPNITQIIFNSIAPSIYGHDFIKKALALAMFGGVAKDPQGKHKIRGDINVLLLGDPGTSKSQCLKYIQQVFGRSVYTTGKGASAVGLTAGVHKDPITKEWTLEGGALVLADKGICLIDEFDKMNDADRVSIHEAMEQQSISISKAGIVTSLQARCSVIAAANPIKGRYDNKLTFAGNVDLTDPILSRFDILCVIKDEVDPVIDHQLATFVINSHIKSHPNFEENIEKNLMLEDKYKEAKDTMSQEMLKKYILYARKNIHPKIRDVNKNKISKFYSELRNISEKSGGIRITVRHLESLLRIAEAFAKMQLRNDVRVDDIDNAIQITLESFLQSQKFTIAQGLRKQLVSYMIKQDDHNQLLIRTLDKIAKEQFQYLKYFDPNFQDNIETININKAAFEKEVASLGIHGLDQFYNSDDFKAKYKIKDTEIVCPL